MIVELSDAENPFVNNNKKVAKSVQKYKNGTNLLKTKQAELDILKKRLISIYDTPTNLDQKSMKIFLKLQSKIKEGFIHKCLEKIKVRNAKLLSKESTNQDTEWENDVDFLLSIYKNLDSHANLVESDKDEIYKNKIQDIIIENWVTSQLQPNKFQSISYLKSMLSAFDRFMKGGQDSISDDQIEVILGYLISQITAEEIELANLEELGESNLTEESKSVTRFVTRNNAKSGSKGNRKTIWYINLTLNRNKYEAC